jgi:hypothetical protein
MTSDRGTDLPNVTDIELPTIDGGRLRLGDLGGRRVLLFCWASW